MTRTIDSRSFSGEIFRMKHFIFFAFLLVCFTIFSCTHNPYQDFQKIQVGDDKAQVLDKVGSPLRSKFQDGKNIWTYRFFDRTSNALVYKDIVLDTEKVLEIKNAKEVDIREIEKKEKMVEQSIKDAVKSREKPAQKPAIDDSLLNETSKSKDDKTFKPVE